ncbi:unnamed protein product [Didymodactylos carnosus]|uniref:Uncharacterized protein n=1 Tax=Didymodactylos carnosus TaxID=1234261 RepID=A0A815EPL5_9BILA|nr:unnamed protein product [Didymodactylos carnosus]CAF1382043.1 unnamed protein product [Didymodactylos carnosus]CAF4152447.1 unnamed protein product [Didymodactylos carnosus]CAF4190409.1 unnamed protein product [Didymodactylos carnosus]
MKQCLVVEEELSNSLVIVENRFQALHVHSDINVIANEANDYRHECLAEEELIENLKQVIHRFMTRTDRRYAYNTRMSWSTDHGHYNVVLSIDQSVPRK